MHRRIKIRTKSRAGSMQSLSKRFTLSDLHSFWAYVDHCPGFDVGGAIKLFSQDVPTSIVDLQLERNN